MTENPGSGSHRRRRRTRSRPDAAAGGTADPAPGAAPTPTQVPPRNGAAPASPPRRRRAGRGADGSDRALRDLVGSGPSQLGVSGALRGRDVNRPTEADLAEAERDLAIVRRHWKPPDSAN